MFKVEDYPEGSIYGGRRCVVDHGRQARLELINGSAQSGGDLFHLTWQDRSIPIVTFSRNAVDRESGQQQVHINIRALGESRYARNSELKASTLSDADRFLARRLAAEALLVFGSWFDGLTFQDGHFVVKDSVDGDDLSYTLSSFGYGGASRPPNYHSRLEWTEQSICRQAVEEAWGLDVPDAVFVIALHNRRRALLTHNKHMKLSLRELFPTIAAAELEDLETRADRLASDAARYGLAHLDDGESIESVLGRIGIDVPGFSRDTYRRTLAYGTLMVLGNRDVERQRRESLVESARSADLRDGAFALLYFNRRYSKSQFLGAIPIHETLGDLHSPDDLDDAIARAGKLIEAGRRYA
ncbi:hypothetical protein [Arthrobacter sp. HMWF013]|uniref:hypothetical protein n=1 Tax=Arthrobacter sp. HMWF013 TaxID=2056849 RepID=UPI000D3D1FDB|nr:hypothetical protein [Arthrobacter sp. HMWF013]PTT63422.1 hypothetical protein DBR22_15595 [Arthrobacter sp. HMWF013]